MVGQIFSILLTDKVASNYENSVPKSSLKDRKTPKFNVDFQNNEFEISLNISRKGKAHWHNALMGFFVDKFTSFHYVKNWAGKF